MCGRFALSRTPADLATVFGTHNAVPNFQPNWNLPPSQPTPVVRHNPKTGERSLNVLRWGLIPHFVRDPAHARMLNNARAETIAKLPSLGWVRDTCEKWSRRRRGHLVSVLA